MALLKYYFKLVSEDLGSPIIIEHTAYTTDESNNNDSTVDMHVNNIISTIKNDIELIRTDPQNIDKCSVLKPRVPISNKEVETIEPGLYVKIPTTKDDINTIVKRIMDENNLKDFRDL